MGFVRTKDAKTALVPMNSKGLKSYPKKISYGPCGTEDCPKKATSSGFCRECSPQGVRDLYRKGLDAANLSALDGLAEDPMLSDMSQETARVRLVLDRTFEKIANIEAIEQRIRDEINESSLENVEVLKGALQNLEAIATQYQLTVAQMAHTLEGLRRTIETHVRLRDGRRLVGDITVGDLRTFLRTVITEVEAVAGRDNARRVAIRIRELSGQLNMGISVDRQL